MTLPPATLIDVTQTAATLNRLMVALADEILGREGRMIAAIGRSTEAWKAP